MRFDIRRLEFGDMAGLSRLYRTVFNASFPYVRSVHTPEEDRAHFERDVFQRAAVWGAFEDTELAGFMAIEAGYIEKLFIFTPFQGHGVGRQLLEFAKADASELTLWTFAKNTTARRFYEKNGFVAVRETDGADNEAHEPDVFYRWTRPSA